MAEERRAGSTQDEFNQIAWRDFLLFAINEPGMTRAFNAATGRRYRVPGVPPSDVQLAEDTAAFVAWVTEHHWVTEYAPLSYQAEYARQQTAD